MLKRMYFWFRRATTRTGANVNLVSPLYHPRQLNLPAWISAKTSVETMVSARSRKLQANRTVSVSALTPVCSANRSPILPTSSVAAQDSSFSSSYWYSICFFFIFFYLLLIFQRAGQT